MTQPRRHPVKYPDITKPVPAPQIKELNAPLPEKKRVVEPWRRYNLTPRAREWMLKERQA